MYPYECSMKHLKVKAKFFANVEGSTTAKELDSINISIDIVLLYTESMYQEDNSEKIWCGGVVSTYAVDGVLDIFYQTGQFGEKLKEDWWSSKEDRHCAHTYNFLLAKIRWCILLKGKYCWSLLHISNWLQWLS